MERDFIKLTIMQFGIVIIFNKTLATKLRNFGWEVLSIFGYEIGISYPTWVFKLIHNEKI